MADDPELDPAGGVPGDAALLEVADDLFALALGEFTGARDARAKQAKADGDAELATRIKALRKPSTAAWVLNLLVRREADQVEQVLAVGAALREAQEAMEAGELRSLTRQRRQVTAALTQQARTHASAAGLRVTAAVADQVEATLTAAMVDPDCGRALRSGLLVASLSTTGVGAVPAEEVGRALAAPEALGFQATARSAPVPPRPELRVVADPDAGAKAIAAAEERVALAEEARRAAADALGEWDEEQARLDARSLQLHAELEELRLRIAELETQGEEIEEEAAGVEEERDEAAAELRRADADLAQAREHLDRVRRRHD